MTEDPQTEPLAVPAVERLFRVTIEDIDRLLVVLVLDHEQADKLCAELAVALG